MGGDSFLKDFYELYKRENYHDADYGVAKDNRRSLKYLSKFQDNDCAAMLSITTLPFPMVV